jgi:membrane-associated protease RseP (regulator of RpoE activity)
MRFPRPISLIVLLLLALAGCASGPVPEIAFTPSQAQFAAGDSITIEQVVGTAPLKAGDRIVVRGRYTLASQREANLMLSLFAGTGAKPTDTIETGIAALKRETTVVTPQVRPRETERESVTRIFKGTGKFEVALRPDYAGELALVLYPPEGGRPFGKVLFLEVEERK